MFQNRVDPFGNIIRTPERGLWLGNRGVIHNERQEIIRPFKIKAWITCALHYRDRHREIMQPDKWTELFFLDEATAFSAGHRPCFQCRYKAHRHFKMLWIAGNPQHGFTMKTPVAEIDAILHSERISSNKTKVIREDDLADMPGGTFVIYNDLPYLVNENKLHQWTAGGYKDPVDFPGVGKLKILTPCSVVNMFRAGYAPHIAVWERTKFSTGM